MPLAATALALLVVHPAALAQIDRLPHADTSRGNYFGAAVAIHGDRILVGAHGESSCGANSGAAYVFERETAAGTWRKVARLLPEDCRSGLYFGRAVALSEDRALIASTSEYFADIEGNAAYVFERDSAGAWHESARLVTRSEASEGPAGAAVGLDGDRALITTWGDPARRHHPGAAYVFERASRHWTEAARISGGGRAGVFGGAAALAADVLAIASSTYFENRPGSVYIFERAQDGTWPEAERIADVDDFFISVDMSETHLLLGESRAGPGRSGLATLYARDSTGVWQLAATLSPPTPYRDGGFGTEVALSTDRALVAGYDEQLRLNYNVDRVVYVYAQEPETGAWSYRSIIDLGTVAFGSSLDLEGRIAVIGAASGGVPGAAYVVHLH